MKREIIVRREKNYVLFLFKDNGIEMYDIAIKRLSTKKFQEEWDNHLMEKIWYTPELRKATKEIFNQISKE